MPDNDQMATHNLPSWFHDFYTNGPCDGFFENMGAHAAAFVDRGPRQLVVSFETLGQTPQPFFATDPWTAKFIKAQGWSHLAIYAHGATWYRDAHLINLFERLARDKFFDQFDQVSFMGMAMGGFAALAFADFAPGAIVVALSPQTTLDIKHAPWENRFDAGRAQNWDLPCSDAAKTLGRIDKAYVVYDPRVALDTYHVNRLPTAHLTALKAFWFGQNSATILQRTGIFQPFMERAITGELTAAQFYKMIQARKDTLIYRRNIEAELTERGKERPLIRFRQAFRKRQFAARQADS